ncbi:MAG: NUDIX hydrolase, partial [Verrucomicrobiales bacterium]
MKKILGKGKFLQLVVEDTWEYVERVKGAAVAVIFPLDGEHVILIEQFRAALNKKIIEMPAGLVGDISADEDILTAAHRELLEETGYEAARMVKVSEGPPSSGITS